MGFQDNQMIRKSLSDFIATLLEAVNPKRSPLYQEIVGDKAKIINESIKDRLQMNLAIKLES
jgi:hypothetical protein